MTLLYHRSTSALILHGDDDQIVPISAAALRSAKLVKNATLKIYAGAPHGLADTHKDQLNADCWHSLRIEVALPKGSMSDLIILQRTPKLIGIAADHGGFELKEQLVGRLSAAGHEVVDFGDCRPDPDDDYPDFVVPLARAVARGEVDRGVAICGSGVGACVVANKVPGVRACLIHETFSAHQGVEDDDMNLICLGGRVLGHMLAWELVRVFLQARFNGADRHRRRLAKVTELESREVKS